jgi:hypothetical protein
MQRSLVQALPAESKTLTNCPRRFQGKYRIPKGATIVLAVWVRVLSITVL